MHAGVVTPGCDLFTRRPPHHIASFFLAQSVPWKGWAVLLILMKWMCGCAIGGMGGGKQCLFSYSRRYSQSKNAKNVCLCLCVCSASVETIANLCFHTSFWWCLVRDLIVLVEIWPSCNFSVASSARRFTFLYPRGSYYCCHTLHKGPKILTKPVAWLLKVIQLVCISLFLQFSSFDSLVRLITLQHL